jgi:hypothetical protein
MGRPEPALRRWRRGLLRGTKGLRADGTDAGTMFLSPAGYSCIWAVAAESGIFFALDSPSFSQSLWKSDGQPGSAVLVRDLPIYPYWPVKFGGGVLFVGHGPSSGSELWTSDGTVAGTQTSFEGPFSSAEEMTVLGPIVMFRSGGSLWRTDGTVAGTSRCWQTVRSPTVSRVRSTESSLPGWISSGCAVRFVAFRRYSGRTRPEDLRVGELGSWRRSGRQQRQGLRRQRERPRTVSSDGTEARTRPCRGSAVFQLEAVPGASPSKAGTVLRTSMDRGGRAMLGGQGSRRVPVDLRPARLDAALRGPGSGHGRSSGASISKQRNDVHTVVPPRRRHTLRRGRPVAPGGRDADFRSAGVVAFRPTSPVSSSTSATQSTGDGHVERVPPSDLSSGARTAAFRAGQTRRHFSCRSILVEGAHLAEARRPGHADVI